jgi:hypothetical protein
LVLWTSYELDQDLPINLSSIAIIVFLLVSVMTVTPLAVVNESSPGSWQKDTTYAANSYQEIEDEFGITEKDEILYLSGGTPTYHLEAESALRYYYPLPLQRSNPELRQSELFSQTYSQAMDFRGQYIVVDHGWFSFNHLPKLSDKLDEEYCAIADPKGPRVEDIVIYERIDEEEMQNCD